MAYKANKSGLTFHFLRIKETSIQYFLYLTSFFLSDVVAGRLSNEPVSYLVFITLSRIVFYAPVQAAVQDEIPSELQAHFLLHKSYRNAPVFLVPNFGFFTPLASANCMKCFYTLGEGIIIFAQQCATQ